MNQDQQPERSASQADKLIRQFLCEDQDPEVVGKIHRRVSDICTRDEEILYIAVQSAMLNPTPDSVVLTNRRFIICHPKLLGRFSFEDYIWRELHDVHLKEGLRGATLTMETTKHARPVSIGRLPKAQARRMYTVAQEMEEKVREERRKRKMEEEKARAGGVTVQSGPALQTQSSQAASEDPVQRLKQLKEMLDAGLITEADYEEKKNDLLSQM